MNSTRAALIEQARIRDGAIYPCTNRASLEECFTEQGGRIVLWYNTASGDTHVAMGEATK